MSVEEVDEIYRDLRERRIYGHDLFLEENLQLFETTDGTYAPDTYVLGEGDVIRINIFGTSQADFMLELTDVCLNDQEKLCYSSRNITRETEFRFFKAFLYYDITFTQSV